MKNDNLKAQTISLMVSAMHAYIKRLSSQPATQSNIFLMEKLRAAENSFYRLNEIAQNLNGRSHKLSLNLEFKKAA